MAPNRRGSGRPRGSVKKAAESVPDVFKDMLAEVDIPSTTTELDSPAPKRRRTGGRGAQTTTSHGSIRGQDLNSIADTTETVSHKSTLSKQGQNARPSLNRQTTYASSSDGSQFEDVDWEEVVLEEDSPSDHDMESLDLDLNSKVTSDHAIREKKRKPITAAERAVRINVHRMHLLCLIAHLRLRNSWCNDKQVQAFLKPLLTSRMLSYLNPDPKLSQFQQTRSLMDGLEQVSSMWKAKFNKTARGLRRAVWVENEEDLAHYRLPDDMDEPLELEDFRRVAQKREGSRDIGAQLLCALLRSAGVETRLVSSLQPLSFASNAGKTTSPKKHSSNIIYANTVEDLSLVTRKGDHEVGTNSNMETRTKAASAQSAPKLAKRLGLPAFGVDKVQEPTVVLPDKPRRHFRESKYPIFWVEVLNKNSLKWISVDSLVTQSIGKPTKFEPPMNDVANTMTYVLVFDADGLAKDVTRRYTKAYNAKVRRQRIECVKDGDRWWWKALRRLHNPFDTNIDQIEDAELAAAEAQEPMPKNVQDFKDHPHYALERHLRRHEVIHPKIEIGRVATGKLSSLDDSKAVESIYRRAHVQAVKSSDRWYRLGREIKLGEQPLKYAVKRRNQSASPTDGNESQDEGSTGIGLYAEFQTILYEAPPVVNGRVPKNSYGNLDLYVPSMVPKGGVHIALPDAAKAARIIGVDYADAVTGFEFRGRHGTAVVRGVVAAKEYQEAILQVILSMNDERVEAEQQIRTLEARRLWRRFFAGLQIRERVQGYDIEGEDLSAVSEQPKVDEAEAIAGGGGFMPDQDGMEIAHPTAGGFSPQDDLSDHLDEATLHNGGGGFIPEVDQPDLQRSHLKSQQQQKQKQSDFSKMDISSTDNRPQNYIPRKSPVRSRYHLEVRPRSGTEDLKDDSKAHQAIPSETHIPKIDPSHVLAAVKETPRIQSVNGTLTHMADNIEIMTDQPTTAVDSMQVDSESDSLSKGSLLSHDPDDDEADPEWLFG